MKRPSIIAVVENGETRCGLTEEITGLGSLPYRLTRSCPEGWEKPQNVFQSMEEVLTEVSLEQYQAYLDHPEEADDYNAMIEIDVDHDVIRIDEDTGMELLPGIGPDRRGGRRPVAGQDLPCAAGHSAHGTHRERPDPSGRRL